MKKDGEKIYKKKIFVIPFIIWIILGIITIVSNRNIKEEDVLTLSEFLISTLIIFIPWYIISYCIHKLLKKHKKNIIKNNITLNNNYKFNCSINENEYCNLVNFFPSIYIKFLIFPIIINTTVAIILYLISNNVTFCLFYFLLILICILFFQHKNLKFNMIKEYKKNKSKFITNYIIEFNNENIIKKYDNKTINILYSEIKKCIKSNENIYLLTKNNMIHIVQFNNNLFNDELLNFLNSKFNIINVEKITTNKKALIAKTMMKILFLGCLISIFGAINTYEYFCKEIYPLKYSFLKNMYVFWFWLPVPLLTIFLGTKYKNIIKTKKYINLGIITGLILMVGGLFCLSSSYEVNYNKIYNYRDFIGFKLPETGKVEYIKWTNWNEKDILEYSTTIVYFEKKDIDIIEKEIKNNKNWIMKGNLPSNLNKYIDIDIYSKEEVYYSIYNQTINAYNIIPVEKNDYKIYVIKYVIPENYVEINEYLYRH